VKTQQNTTNQIDLSDLDDPEGEQRPCGAAM